MADNHAVRTNAVSKMLRGYSYATGVTPEEVRFEIKVAFFNPNRSLGRGVNPEKPALHTRYEVYFGGQKMITLDSEELVKSLIENNGWTIE